MSVSSAELRRNFGYWQQKAFSTPVTVVRHGKPRLVLSSAQRFFEGQTPGHDEQVHPAVAAIPDHSFEGFVALDRELRIRAVNRVFEDLTSRSAADLLGRVWSDLFPPQDSTFATQMRHVLRYGEAVQFETASLLVPGRCYACSAFPHSQGVALLLANRTAERELREEVDEVRALQAAMERLPSTAHLKINLRGMLQSSSAQFTRLTGFDPITATHNIRFVDLLQLRDRERGADLLEEVLTQGRTGALPTALTTMSGELCSVDLAIAPIWRGAAIVGAIGAVSRRPGEMVAREA